MLTSEQIYDIAEMVCAGAACTPHNCDCCQTPPDENGEECPQFIIQALLSDRAELVAEIDRLRAALKAGQVGHIIEFRDNGWTIQHPLSCRPNLFECEVNRAAERDVDGVPPEGVGRYVCGAEEGGRFWYDGASNAALEARDE